MSARPMPIDPIAEARRQWVEHGWADAAAGMTLVTSVNRAQQLLEVTDLGLDSVAQQSGFGTAALLRHHFTRQLGVAPSAYRRRFACPEPALAQH